MPACRSIFTNVSSGLPRDANAKPRMLPPSGVLLCASLALISFLATDSIANADAIIK